MTTHLAVKPSSPPVTLPSPRLPHSLELTVLFREFIRYWTGFQTRIPDSGPTPNLPEPIEYATRWNGSVKGTLVLRASNRLLEKLAAFFQDKGLGVSSRNALFQEMATLYSIFLVHYAWMDELFELGPILARPSRPSLWPAVEPHAFCAIEVEGEPVEIRLWLDDPGKSGKDNPMGGGA